MLLTRLMLKKKNNANGKTRFAPAAMEADTKGQSRNLRTDESKQKIRDAIKQNKSSHEIEGIAVEDGMTTLKGYAVELIKSSSQPFPNSKNLQYRLLSKETTGSMQLARQIVEFAIKAGSSGYPPRRRVSHRDSRKFRHQNLLDNILSHKQWINY